MERKDHREEPKTPSPIWEQPKKPSQPTKGNKPAKPGANPDAPKPEPMTGAGKSAG
jgi:hypothetical protein